MDLIQRFRPWVHQKLCSTDDWWGHFGDMIQQFEPATNVKRGIIRSRFIERLH
jgi:hypothetical protein